MARYGHQVNRVLGFGSVTHCALRVTGRPGSVAGSWTGLGSALIDAGHRRLADLPANLRELLPLHGVGPQAVRLLAEARDT